MKSAGEKAKEIFLKAVEQHSEDQWEAFLDGACGDQPEVRCRVEGLLKAHAEMGTFQDDAASSHGDPTAHYAPVKERSGSQIGPYKLLQKIGEGGFGVVYMAEQERPVRRKVALKVIKPGMDSQEVISRFEAEEQALALMDHPNIARVFDAGATESGRPYFVMELVKGIPITDFCDKSDLTPEERLGLFMSVCNAVQHAHQKGVIHRDIKPNNVLVTLHDGEPVVKVIDFGVAKATNVRLTERTLFTRFEQMIGTPMYMSPEQAEMSGLDVDTRTDIYSLGVLLYELLTGSTPFDRSRLMEAGLDEIRRIIREEEPVKPSTKISTLKQVAADVSKHRKTEPKRLSAALRGDLDWIVMKALEKDRRRRYETAKDFAQDIGRYLSSEPVEASPPSLIYRTRKFVRRNRAFVAGSTTAALMLVLLVAGGWKMSVSGLKTDIAERKLELAEKERIINEKLAEEAKQERVAEEQRRIRSEARQQKLERRKTDLPTLRQRRTEENWAEAFELADRLRADFPEDEEILQLWREVSCKWTVVTEPPGAEVYRKPYADCESDWEQLGTSPLDAASRQGFFRWKIVKAGYETVEGCSGPKDVDIETTLDSKGSAPTDMVRVTVASLHERDVDFLIDRYEVTNRQFMQFVQSSGYSKKEYWKHPFLRDGDKVSWEDAVSCFVDATGKAGPSTWRNGAYPRNHGDYPVCGVSWYEAAAYAAFAQKRLPSIYDVQLASGKEFTGWIVPESNFDGPGPAEVGEYQGVGPFGTYDMAGNVKEWCWNQGTSQRRFIFGGAWSDSQYMFGGRDARPPFDRSETNGFRCVIYLTPPDEQLLADVVTDYRDYSQEQPVSDDAFEAIQAMYEYDKKPLNAQVIRTEDSGHCRHEVVEFDATYGDDRVIAHLFLPKDAAPPYQTVIYFPGGHADDQPRFPRHAARYDVFPALLNSGRAVVWPVYMGTYERGAGIGPSGVRDYVNRYVQQAHDLFRTVDYLQERPDIDVEKLAYLGSSWGARLGPVFLASEDRIRAAIFFHGGLHTRKAGLPREVDTLNFLPRVTIPSLMVNGKGDEIFPLETSQRPYFQHLGTADADKEHCVVEGFHTVAIEHREREALRWLDRYFGPAWSEEELAGLTEQEKLDRMEMQARRSLGLKRLDDAEKICRDTLESRRRILGAEHRDTLNTISLLALIAQKQKRNKEAVALFEQALEAQLRELGNKDADTMQTAEALHELYVIAAWTGCIQHDAVQEDCDRAVQYAQRVLELEQATEWKPSKGKQWLLGLALLRQGEEQAALDAMEKSFAAGEAWIGGWLIMAMVEWENGRKELAQDWYTAACEWIAKSNDKWSGNRQLREQAAALLGMPSPWPPDDWSREKYLQTYNRLIESQPDIARLYHCRGSHNGRKGAWGQAKTDYARAAELDTRYLRHAEAETAVAMFMGTLEERRAAGRRFFDSFRESSNMDVVLLCSLVPDLDVNRKEIDQLADDVLAKTETRFFLELAKGMSLYHLKEHEAALAILPTGDGGGLKNEMLAILFRAMAHHQLGDAYTCRKLLEQAREGIEEQIPTPEGPMLPYQDRPVVWCMIQTALREAEALIEPADDSLKEATNESRRISNQEVEFDWGTTVLKALAPVIPFWSETNTVTLTSHHRPQSTANRQPDPDRARRATRGPE